MPAFEEEFEHSPQAPKWRRLLTLVAVANAFRGDYASQHAQMARSTSCLDSRELTAAENGRGCTESASFRVSLGGLSAEVSGGGRP